MPAITTPDGRTLIAATAGQLLRLATDRRSYAGPTWPVHAGLTVDECVELDLLMVDALVDGHVDLAVSAAGSGSDDA